MGRDVDRRRHWDSRERTKEPVMSRLDLVDVEEYVAEAQRAPD